MKSKLPLSHALLQDDIGTQKVIEQMLKKNGNTYDNYISNRDTIRDENSRFINKKSK